MSRSLTARCLVAAALALFLTAPCPGEDTVNLSRYSVSASGSGNVSVLTVAELEGSVLYRYCRDQDGCTVTLTSEDDDELRVVRTSLFIGQDARLWNEPSGASREDNNGDIGNVLTLSVEGGAHHCYVTDGEPPFGSDSGFGFSLVIEAGTPVDRTCTVVLED